MKRGKSKKTLHKEALTAMPIAQEEMTVVRVQMPMDFPLPRRNWQTDNGGLTWYSVEWTPETWDAAKHGHFKTVSRIVPKRLLPHIQQVQE